jgi:hypothetical protein
VDKNADRNITRLESELDRAISRGDAEGAEAAAERLFRLRGGAEADAVMPAHFPSAVKQNAGGRNMKAKHIRKMLAIAAAAALITTLCLTAVATDLFGIKDLVMKNDDVPNTASETETPAAETGATSEPRGAEESGEPEDLIVLQGYPDSSEYKASEEWNLFCENYDTDGSVLAEVGNGLNEYTEKYPMYLVYSREMADKLEEILLKYNLTPHESMTVVQTEQDLYAAAGAGAFLSNPDGGSNQMLGGYVYNDGSFHYDGAAVLGGGKNVPYQLGNYVKGTFSATYLNVGDANRYQEWSYETKSGVQVNLALGAGKSLVITDLGSSFVSINVLTGSSPAADGGFGGNAITADDLQAFADSFDFSQIR